MKKYVDPTVFLKETLMKTPVLPQEVFLMKNFVNPKTSFVLYWKSLTF